jgi:tripartite-type tricarboxylate transporter receptor subunit TctC
MSQLWPLVHIHCQSCGAPAADDDAGGHIALMTAPIPVALPLAQGAKVRMLGVTTKDSSARTAGDSAPNPQPKRAPVVHCTSELA